MPKEHHFYTDRLYRRLQLSGRLSTKREEDRFYRRVTERFYRCQGNCKAGGVGLGLSVVEAVARLHDGVLDLSGNHPGSHRNPEVPGRANAQHLAEREDAEAMTSETHDENRSQKETTAASAEPSEGYGWAC